MSINKTYDTSGTFFGLTTRRNFLRIVFLQQIFQTISENINIKIRQNLSPSFRMLR